MILKGESDIFNNEFVSWLDCKFDFRIIMSCGQGQELHIHKKSMLTFLFMFETEMEHIFTHISILYPPFKEMLIRLNYVLEL